MSYLFEKSIEYSHRTIVETKEEIENPQAYKVFFKDWGFLTLEEQIRNIEKLKDVIKCLEAFKK